MGVLKGNGDGTFQAMRDTFEYGAQNVKVADLNHDQRPDLVLNNAQGSEIFVMINKGNLQFEVTVLSTDFWNTNDIEIADFKRNGNPDIASISVSNNANNCIIFSGQANGKFLKKKAYTINSRPVDIEVADLNKDGYQDIVLGFDISTVIGVMLGTSDTTFSVMQLNYALSSSYGMLIRDWNMDGILDISAGMWVLEGIGDGSFKTKKDFLNRINTVELTSGDFNGDQKPDLASENSDGEYISLYE